MIPLIIGDDLGSSDGERGGDSDLVSFSLSVDLEWGLFIQIGTRKRYRKTSEDFLTN